MKLLGRIILVAIAYVLGTVVTGMIAGPLHLPALELPKGATTAGVFKALLLTSPLLAAFLVPLACGLKGTWAKRFLAVGVLLFAALGLNTIIELLIFSTMFKGAGVAASLHWVLPCAIAAVALTLPAKEKAGTTIVRPGLGAIGWCWRLIVAWLAFPVIYFFFGVFVGPIVAPYYYAGVLGLRIPPMGTIMTTQLLRSAIFLAASLPIVLLWAKSRRSLIVALGLGHAVTVGIFGLAQAYWFPTILRVLHSIEITADSFAYAWVLALLFTQASKMGESAALHASMVAAQR